MDEGLDIDELERDREALEKKAKALQKVKYLSSSLMILKLILSAVKESVVVSMSDLGRLQGGYFCQERGEPPRGL